MTIRVRFAPSPTGNLHLGGARTALFNWLLARRHKGVFILRIEDTDELRSNAEFEQSIFRGMKWLGLDWDEGPCIEGGEKGDYGPYYQSKRAEQGVYKAYADRLLAEGKAYYCYCTPEELEEERRRATLEKRPPRYNGRCRDLTAEQRLALEAQGRKPVIRFKMPAEGTTVFNDPIRGEVKFENKLLYDFIMQKYSGYPTYNFACVIDDHLMKITHILRGDDHISNTAHQINLYRALGFEMPEFMHLSMIHGPDGTKLSKRHGHTGIFEYEAEGFLPEAMMNYLALLGWSNTESQQLFGPGELEAKFDIAGCQKNPAVFDPVKLKWMNGEYIRKMPADELARRALPFLTKAGVDVSGDREKLVKIVAIEQEKYKLLTEIPPLVDFFFTEQVEFDPESVEKVLKKPGAKAVLRGIAAVYGQQADFKEKELEAAARRFAADSGLKAGQVFHPLRVAASGRTQGPTLFLMLEYLGRETVLRRLESAKPLCAE
ncbi:MAG: glutamate--tRNA ligase [Elusimicrobiaceae bacterium]|nr:glutamate--tRNA ligase [Elusimicrobiaceae bacterium]